MQKTACRLIFDAPASGVWNMAADEVLLETAASARICTLRLYSWDQPTLSLGYFQVLADRAGHLASRGCPVVRRASGGGAIVHDQEWTYSLSLPAEAYDKPAEELYKTVHRVWIAALTHATGEPFCLLVDSKQLSLAGSALSGFSNADEPFLCFKRRSDYDVLHNGAKIAGSAQRRRHGALLQHGSLLLRHSEAAPELPGLTDLFPQFTAELELRQSWLRGLADEMNWEYVVGELTSAERQSAEAFSLRKYGAQSWTGRR